MGTTVSNTPITAMTPTDRETLQWMADRYDMSATARYEQDAETFYAATGLMAPGKDVPMAMGGQDEQERRLAWDLWVQNRNRRQLAALRAALASPAAPPAPADLVALREALIKVRGHTCYHPPGNLELLRGLLQSIERIADAALAVAWGDAAAAPRVPERDTPQVGEIDTYIKMDPDHPPTDECPDMECMQCGMRDCPDNEPLHYHHDGCPCCSQEPTR